jgi:hypothetical protein
MDEGTTALPGNPVVKRDENGLRAFSLHIRCKDPQEVL